MSIDSAERRGFALLEAIVSTAIIGAVAAAAITAAAAQIRGVAAAREATVAAALAEDSLDRLRLLPRGALLAIRDSMRAGRFEGALSGGEFVSVVRRVRGEQDLVEVEVRITTDAASARLVTRLYRPERPEAGR